LLATSLRRMAAFDAKVLAELLKQNPESELPRWTLHDLRRTARSLMSRAGVPSDHAERCLGHVLPGIRGTYDRHEYLAEKRRGLGLTVDNTQFAQFREEIIKALGACIVLTACTAVRTQPRHRYAQTPWGHIRRRSHLAGTPRAADVQSGRQRRIIHSRRIGSFPNAQLHTAFGAAPPVDAPSEGQCLTIKHASLLKRRLRNVLSGGLGPSG
jgi:hypothetical protein